MSSLPAGFLMFYIFIIGLCIGSFLNVAILRGLSGENMVFERSRCPKCKNQLKWYMNIPLLSYIFLRGKCAFCHEKISIQYPVVELIVGLLFLVCYLSFGLTLKTLFVCCILSIFVLLCATDFKKTVILDYHAYILTAVGILYAISGQSDISAVQSLIGAVCGFLIFEILSRTGLFLIGFRMFGEGDSLIVLGLGAVFGIKTLLIIVALSFLIQCAGAVPVLIKNAFRERKIKLALSYLFVFASIFLVIGINYFNLLKDDLFYLAFVCVISILLFWCLKNIIFEINLKKARISGETEEEKFEKSPFCLLPFGPALVFAATICIFFLPQIKSFILKFLY